MERVIKTVNAYVKSFPNETQVVLKQIQEIIKKIVPKAEETISYGIAAFKLNGTYLIYFAGFKNHVSLYPISSKVLPFETELFPYRSGKATVRFPLNGPIPYSLIKKIAQYRLKENLVKTKIHTTTSSRAQRTKRLHLTQPNKGVRKKSGIIIS